MKPTLLTAFTVAGLGMIPATTAQEAAASAPQEQQAAPQEAELLNADITIYGYPETLCQGEQILLDFATPMVPEDALSTAQTAGYYRLYYSDNGQEVPCKAEWLSASALKITITEETRRLSYITVAVPEGVKDAEGKAYKAISEQRCSCRGIKIYSTSSYVDSDVIFIGSRNAEDDELLEQKLQEAYFQYAGTTFSPNIRQATVQDALNHWAAYENAFEDDMPRDEEDKMKALPADTPLPHTWICDIPFTPHPENTLSLVLPQTYTNYSAEKYEDDTIYNKRGSSAGYSLQNTCQGMSEFEVCLNFYSPAEWTTTEDLVKQLSWEVLDYRHNDTRKALVWKNGALRTNIRGVDICLTPDEEQMQQLAQEVTTDAGRKVRVVRSLIFKAETGGSNAPYLNLYVSGDYQGIYEKCSPTHQEVRTRLKPSVPYIFSDVSNGQMMRNGSTTINCSYENITNGKATLYRIDSSAENVAALLNAYATWYREANVSGISDEQLEELNNTPTHRINRMRVVPTEFLPGVLEQKEVPLEKMRGETQLNLAEQFGTARASGFYFVNIEGRSIRKDDYGAPVVNQGLVQVTNLGLLWKLNGRRIFAWGYHLSDGTEVAQATLRMLDSKGKILAETPVTQGIAQADFPAQTRFLQLCTQDDSVMITYDPSSDEYEANGNYLESCLQNIGTPLNELPQALIYLFADRSLYRPGEQAHIKGMVRWVCNNELSTAKIASIRATVFCNGKKVTEQTIKPEADGHFSMDYTPTHVGSHDVNFSITYEGDDNQTSPDFAVLKRYNAKPDDWYPQNYLITPSREANIYLMVEEFRRNEFEIRSTLETDWKEKTVNIAAKATNFTSTPVAGGDVEWNLRVYRKNFYPQQWKDFYFGDYREPYSTLSRFYAYYMDDTSRGEKYLYSDHETATLDDNGCGSKCFSLPQTDDILMGRISITASACITNGNQQSITSVKETLLDPCEVYTGIKTADRIVRAGEALPVEVVAVKPDGSAWDGAALQGTITVKRTSYRVYRYGSAAATSIHNAEDTETVQEIPVSFGAEPIKAELPVDKAGQYTITVSCTDTAGNTTASAITHYVWGDNESPWYYRQGSSLSLVPDKDMYRAGDTANILVQTPVDAEVLVTLERGQVIRHYKRTITVNNPVIQVPVEAGDAPVVYAGVSIIQSAEDRPKSGKPLIKMGVCALHVEKEDKVLSIDLQAPEEHLLPQDTCTVSGCVRDAAGNPVANAHVTLFAEDEGTLQVRGYTLPTPQRFFYSERGRFRDVRTYSALGQLISDSMEERTLGNKGVFIGGGDGAGSASSATSDEEAQYLRRNFNPCALWLSSVQTDENGCFSVSYNNPDTLTRYRLMAVAATEDRFGSAKTAYHVTKPIMLEPVAPLSAAEGDILHMPVTVSMLPEHLPQAANGSPVEWKVSLSGTNVSLPEAEKTVSLSGNKPVTVTFPIHVGDAGTAELQWKVQAASPAAAGTLARCTDAVQLDFPVIPPTPFLRERLHHTLKVGQTASLKDWLTVNYRAGSPVNLTISTSPFNGLFYYMEYLIQYPYGCSEQLSSAVIPWILMDELNEALGITLPHAQKRMEVLHRTFQRLNNDRRLTWGSFKYWDGSEERSDFSPYVVLVHKLAQEKQLDLPGCGTWDLRQHYSALEREILPVDPIEQNLKKLAENQDPKPYTVTPDLLSLYVLTSANALSEDMWVACADRMEYLKDPSATEMWMLAVCARLRNNSKAAEYRNQALALEKNPQARTWGSYHLPPIEVLRILYAIADAPNAPETTEALFRYLDNGISEYSTWRNAWATIAVHEYLKATKLQNKRAIVNGRQVDTKNPLCLHTTTDCADSFSTQQNTVYVNGYAEGHMATPQSVRTIDQGLRVTRRYEKLMPDGSWVPTATFEVGDVVKVHIKIAAGDSPATDNLRYLVVEDRLPAAFEAVNPELSSQALPAGLDEEQTRDWWHYSTCIDNKEFLKDRVRFFASYLYGKEMEATYVARVLRRGKVTAPAAKAELMYRPEVRGLSIPQQFEVK
ncbi:MAG: hypothetical protein E7033_04385 [Akkermansiaceae bacterium]|nr:hypothetical protein [Akkermansiaceae bacterium]